MNLSEEYPALDNTKATIDSLSPQTHPHSYSYILNYLEQEKKEVGV